MKLINKSLAGDSFYKTLFALAVPMMLQNLICFSLNLLDSIMIGKLGDINLSAVALANQPFFIISLFFFGMGSGASVLISQYWGKHDTKTIAGVVTICVTAVFAVSTLGALVVMLFPKQIMSVYTNNPVLMEKGAEYLRIICFSYPLTAISTLLAINMRSMEIIATPLKINILAIATNTVLNYCLIYGKLGFPQMGIRGAALATVSARLIEFILMLLYMLKFNPKIKFELRSFFRVDNRLIKDFMIHSSPVVANELLWAIGISIQSMIIGRLGASAVAAFSINNTLQQIAFAAILGIGNAIAVIVGKEVGRGNIQTAHTYSKQALRTIALSGFVGMVFIFAARIPFISLYNISAETHQLVTMMTLFLCLVFYIKGFNYTIIVGILRGSGDAKFAAVIDIAFLWGIGLPLGILAAFVFSLPIWVVYLCFMTDEACKLIFGAIRIARGKYIKNVTRDFT